MGPQPAEAQLTLNDIYFFGPVSQYLLSTYLFINYNVHTSVFFFSLSCTESNHNENKSFWCFWTFQHMKEGDPVTLLNWNNVPQKVKNKF